MRMLSYHTKMRLRKILTIVGIVLLVLITIWACWMVWLQRYVVFTRDGVVFDFDRSTLSLPEKAEGQVMPEETIPINIQVLTQDEAEDQAQKEETLSGFYADTDMLRNDFETVKEVLKGLPEGTAVMLDVKSMFGNFYYTTSINGANQSSAVNAEEMDQLIQSLSNQGVYLIARLPAFRDSAFAEAHLTSGLAMSSGALWQDDENCYWLDPSSETVLTHLIQISQELRKKGFDEVVFSDFSIPDSGNISYPADTSKDDVIRQAAGELVSACATGEFVVSFCSGADFPLPAGKSRLYLENVDPVKVQSTFEGSMIPNKEARLVFVTSTRDTRFDEYSVLRSAQ